jgi:hypothetical protein
MSGRRVLCVRDGEHLGGGILVRDQDVEQPGPHGPDVRQRLAWPAADAVAGGEARISSKPMAMVRPVISSRTGEPSRAKYEPAVHPQGQKPPSRKQAWRAPQIQEPNVRFASPVPPGVIGP